MKRPALVPDPSFEVAAAAENLFVWLTSRGHADPHAGAYAATIEHGFRHQESTPARDRCYERPCRALAAAEALLHCLTYQNALGAFGRELGYAAVGEMLLGNARANLRLLEEAAREVASASEERHRRQAEPVQGSPALRPGHDHGLLCVAPGLVVEQLKGAFKALEVLAEKLRSYPDVPGLRKRAGRGRYEEELLTLVWQTLRVGGFTYREIAEFVPPSDGGHIQELINRVEKRVKKEMLWVTDNQPDERFILKVTPTAVGPNASVAPDVTPAHGDTPPMIPGGPVAADAGPAQSGTASPNHPSGPVETGAADASDALGGTQPPPAPDTARSAAAPPPPRPENIADVFSPADSVNRTSHVDLVSDDHAEDTKDTQRGT